MKSYNVSLISVLTNIVLSVSQITTGLVFSSAALVADGIHSGVDIFSSFITYLGTKIATKEKDERHPYGYYKSENLAGLVVTLLLFISGIVILYEAYRVFVGEAPMIQVKPTAIIVAVFAVLITEGLARFKFYFGEKNRSLALIADAEHSQADALSSVGVLLGLFFSKYFPLADGFITAGIGIYILYEAYGLGKEITDSLLDVANKKLEEKIKKIARAKEIEISDLKTRQIGSYNSAELKIKLPPKLKVEEIEKIINDFEKRLKNNIAELQYTTITIESYGMEKSTINTTFKNKVCADDFQKIGPKKKGQRVVFPVKDKDGTKLNARFGSRYFLIIDLQGKTKTTKKVMQNPYFKDTPHGNRFLKAVRADKLVTLQIGENAKQSLANFGIKVEISNTADVAKIIDKLKEIKDE